MRIATWNVNSIRQRLDHLITFLKDADPDVVCLQELKCTDDAFPRAEVEAAGYQVETHGQKGFNGVALLSKTPLDEVRRSLPGDAADEQARYIEAVVSDGDRRLRVASIYLPNGNPLGTEKFPYKLAWMERLRAHAEALLALEVPLVLAGDYNVIPEPRDVRNPEAWTNDALYQPESRAAFRRLQHLGLADAVRLCTDRDETYTFWDYQAASWQRNNGIRIDHILLSPQAADRLTGAAIHKHVRGWDKPSDHVPVAVDLAG
ncbi:MAG TPA: exodeoxyribonuclease III [Beijerinckiaceae bacterium]|jgi:exodeoxyribonuclease-3